MAAPVLFLDMSTSVLAVGQTMSPGVNEIAVQHAALTLTNSL